MDTVIIKFGGTSVSTEKNLKTICVIVNREKEKNPLIVVSAFSKVTDLLLLLSQKKRGNKGTIEKIRQIHEKLINQLFSDTARQKQAVLYIEKQLKDIKKLGQKKRFTKANVDRLISYGEIMSSYIVSEVLQSSGINSKQIIASDIISTTNEFGSAEFLVEKTKKQAQKILKPLLSQKIVPVVTGFIGATKDGEITTLGRGGSDYTAAIIGYCLDALEIQIWTDVDGIFTADPRIVKQARLLPEVSFREASEMAFFGAKVLHPRTIRPAISMKIPIRVLNTFNLESPGTKIVDKTVLKSPITAVSFKRDVTLVNMYSTAMLLTKGFLASIFTTFAKHNISIDLVSVSEVSVTVTLDNDENLETAIKDLKKFTSVTYTKNVSIVSLIGDGIINSPATIQNIFSVLAKSNILVKMISLGATNVNVSIVIDSEKLEDAVKVLHSRLLLKKLVE